MPILSQKTDNFIASAIRGKQYYKTFQREGTLPFRKEKILNIPFRYAAGAAPWN
jgi:hypothetical protein